jgi:hypothetical protein
VLFQALSIPKLDDCGAAQLACDLDYLTNVTSALGLAPSPFLAQLHSLAVLDRRALTDHLARPNGQASGQANGKTNGTVGLGVARKLDRQFAAVRAVAVAFGDD